MICNICGGAIPNGENICKYCGNVMNAPKNEQKLQPQQTIEMPPSADLNNATAQTQIFRSNRPDGGYCRICNRPLDGVTHKCIVCDAKEVSKRAYTYDEYTNKEMDIMAQRKKKKNKTNTVLGVMLAILATIALFLFAIIFARGKVADWLGIGSQDTEKPAITMTHKPRVTADPNWQAEVDDEKETPKPTERPVRTPVPEPTGDPVDLRGGEYLYPSDTTLISEEELQSLSRTEIKRIYWEIYARHGCTFDGELADYFENNHPWYMPTTTDEKEVESKFNSIEKRNKETIFNYQKKMGWR